MEAANGALSSQCRDGVSKDWNEWTIDVSPWKDSCDRDTTGQFARPASQKRDDHLVIFMGFKTHVDYR